MLAVSSSKESLEQTQATARRDAIRRYHQRSPRLGLSSRIRVEARVGREERSVISTLPEGIQYLVMHVRRGDADLLGQSRPRARVRRPRWPADRSRELSRDAQVLRRLHQRHGRVQLHLHWARHGTRLFGRGDPRAGSWRRQARHRPCGRARGSARPRQCVAPAV